MKNIYVFPSSFKYPHLFAFFILILQNIFRTVSNLVFGKYCMVSKLNNMGQKGSFSLTFFVKFIYTNIIRLLNLHKKFHVIDLWYPYKPKVQLFQVILFFCHCPNLPHCTYPIFCHMG